MAASGGGPARAGTPGQGTPERGGQDVQVKSLLGGALVHGGVRAAGGAGAPSTHLRRRRHQDRRLGGRPRRPGSWSRPPGPSRGRTARAPPPQRHGGRGARGSGAARRPQGAAHAAPEKPRPGGVAGARGRGACGASPAPAPSSGLASGLQSLLENQPRARSSPTPVRPEAPRRSDSPRGRKSSPRQPSLAQSGEAASAQSLLGGEVPGCFA